MKTKIIGSDLHISWTRRTRIGGDDWASPDVPLGEEVERYEVDFMGGAAVLLTKETIQPSLQIPITDLETHYGAPLGEITLTVHQLSQAYGRGAGRISTFLI